MKRLSLTYASVVATIALLLAFAALILGVVAVSSGGHGEHNSTPPFAERMTWRDRAFDSDQQRIPQPLTVPGRRPRQWQQSEPGDGAGQPGGGTGMSPQPDFAPRQRRGSGR